MWLDWGWSLREGANLYFRWVSFVWTSITLFSFYICSWQFEDEPNQAYVTVTIKFLQVYDTTPHWAMSSLCSCWSGSPLRVECTAVSLMQLHNYVYIFWTKMYRNVCVLLHNHICSTVPSLVYPNMSELTRTVQQQPYYLRLNSLLSQNVDKVGTQKVLATEQ